MCIKHLITVVLLSVPSCVVDAIDEATANDSNAGMEAREDSVRGVLELCKLLAYDKTEVRGRFCLSQLDNAVAGRCWAHLLRSPVAWRNWCEYEFSY